MTIYDAMVMIARDAHATQVRKYTALPYFTHLVNVATLVAKYQADFEHFRAAFRPIEHYQAIAIGHDLFEDTEVTPISLKFSLLDMGVDGAEADFVISGIVALTDVYTREAYPDLNRNERKLRESHRLALIPFHLKLVKLCDLLDNTADIAQNDKDFARVYLIEKMRLLDIMRRHDEDLLDTRIFSDTMASVIHHWTQIYE